jgi:hypothetical protein
MGTQDTGRRHKNLLWAHKTQDEDTKTYYTIVSLAHKTQDEDTKT